LHKAEDNTPSENGLFHNRIFEKSKFVLQFTYIFCFEKKNLWEMPKVPNRRHALKIKGQHVFRLLEMLGK
jgi:hypothetical protein